MSSRGDNNVHFQLGELCIPNVYMTCIGDHIAKSDIPQLWIEVVILTVKDFDEILHGLEYKGRL